MDNETLLAMRRMALDRAKAEISSLGHASYRNEEGQWEKLEKLSKEFFNKVDDWVNGRPI